MERPIPRQPTPDLQFSLVEGGTWRLSEQQPSAFTMVVFYRGLHCPVCRTYNRKLNTLIDKYEARGVNVVVVSMDTEERAKQTVEDWSVDNLTVGYGLTEEAARNWGLYFSHSIADKEPDLFSEPGLFLIRPDGTLYYAAANSMPFGRPDLEAMLQAIDFIKENDYPARGEVEYAQVA